MTVLNQWVSLSFCLVNHMDYAFVIQAELILGVLASEWSNWNNLHKKKKMKLLSCFHFSFCQSWFIKWFDSKRNAQGHTKTVTSFQATFQHTSVEQYLFPVISFSYSLAIFYFHECWMEYHHIQLLRAPKLFQLPNLINSCGWSTAKICQHRK